MNNHSNNLKQPQSRLSRHDHNISAGYTSTMSTGMIIPQYYHILGPGDSFYGSTKSFVRLKDIVTAFLGEVEIHYDWFFVPLQMMYTPFGQIFAQTNDFVSNVFQVTTDMPSDSYPMLMLKGTLSTQSTNVVLNGECLGKSTTRLLDALNGGSLGVVGNMPTDTEEPYSYYSLQGLSPLIASPFLFAAYQCIYQKFYRNEQYEKLSISAYNFDSAYQQNTFRNFELLTLRWHQRKDDYFTSLRPSPLYSAVNSVVNSNTFGEGAIYEGQNTNLSSVVNYVNGSSAEPESFAASSFNDMSGYSDDEELVSTYAFSNENNAANIRTLFAVDKFLRVYGRAGKTYDDQVLAHFGVKVPHDVKHDLTHLKHYQCILTSDPVYSTSQNDDVLLGQVGGQSQTSLDADQFKFTAPVHGVIMCCAYAVCRPRYQYTFDKLHRLQHRYDFPIPEFDKLGAQPIFAYEAIPYALENGNGYNMYSRFGWQNRYNQFKQKYNRVSLAFTHGEEFNGDPIADNPYSAWVLSRSPYGTYEPTQEDEFDTRLDMSRLYESPNALNSVMSVPFDGAWSLSYYQHPYLMFQTDPLIVETYVKAKLVSWMSETGEPDL